MSKQGKIGVTSENIFPVIKKFLYSEHDIFLRELVSNAVDASQKLRALASAGEFKGELGDLKVSISFDADAKTITVSDRGIGMTAEEVEKYINQIAFSGAEEFLDKYKDDKVAIIGHFGLGFYSSFMVSSRVEIQSLSYREGAELSTGAAKVTQNTSWRRGVVRSEERISSCILTARVKNSSARIASQRSSISTANSSLCPSSLGRSRSGRMVPMSIPTRITRSMMYTPLGPRSPRS